MLTNWLAQLSALRSSLKIKLIFSVVKMVSESKSMQHEPIKMGQTLGIKTRGVDKDFPTVNHSFNT